MKNYEEKNFYWRINTAGFLKEIADSGLPRSAGVLKVPLNIFQGLLVQVGERASELNDPKLNALMCRLAIYAESDPYSPDYNAELTEKTINAIYK
jgi:hypothetical protein